MGVARSALGPWAGRPALSSCTWPAPTLAALQAWVTEARSRLCCCCSSMPTRVVRSAGARPWSLPSAERNCESRSYRTEDTSSCCDITMVSESSCACSEAWSAVSASWSAWRASRSACSLDRSASSCVCMACARRPATISSVPVRSTSPRLRERAKSSGSELGRRARARVRAPTSAFSTSILAWVSSICCVRSSISACS